MASNRPEADDDFFYLKTCAGYAWPRLPAGGNSLIWSAYRELERSQWLTPDALRARQCQQLRALLRHSVARSLPGTCAAARVGELDRRSRDTGAGCRN